MIIAMKSFMENICNSSRLTVVRNMGTLYSSLNSLVSHVSRQWAPDAAISVSASVSAAVRISAFSVVNSSASVLHADVYCDSIVDMVRKQHANGMDFSTTIVACGASVNVRCL
uniref:Uncharacterized protein n=1 Tax=Sipha flava TaxID=143950 RepID=A0A2S2R3B2_9HEMI